MKIYFFHFYLFFSILNLTQAFCPLSPNQTTNSPKQWIGFENSTTENTTDTALVDIWMNTDGKSGFYKDRP